MVFLICNLYDLGSVLVIVYDGVWEIGRLCGGYDWYCVCVCVCVWIVLVSINLKKNKIMRFVLLMIKWDRY